MKIELKRINEGEQNQSGVEEQVVAFFKGREPRQIKIILEELHGIIDIHELALKYKVSSSDMTDIIKNLQDLNYIEVVDNISRPRVLIVSDCFLENLQHFAIDFSNFNNFTVQPLREVESMETYDLVIAFDLQHNTSFFSKVSALARKYRKEWLHFAVSLEKIWFGPLFWSGSNTCYDCYAKTQEKTILYEDACYHQQLQQALLYFKKYVSLLHRVHQRYAVLANRALIFSLDSSYSANVELVKPSLCENFH